MSLLPAGLGMFLMCLFFRNAFPNNLSGFYLVRQGSDIYLCHTWLWLVTSDLRGPGAQTPAAVPRAGEEGGLEAPRELKF